MPRRNPIVPRLSWMLFGLELTGVWIVAALFLQRHAIGLAFDPLACTLGDPSVPARGLVVLGMASPLDCQALLHIGMWRALGLTLLVPAIGWLLGPPLLYLAKRLIEQAREI